MENKFKLFQNFIHAICILATLICVYQCFYQYQLDLDVSLVENKLFDAEEGYIKPAISMCFFDPFIPQKFDDNYPHLNMSDYKSFVSGKLWKKNLLKVNFEKVTRMLDDYIVGYFIQWNNASFKFYYNESDVVKKPRLSYVGFYVNWVLKCYSVDLPLDATILEFVFRKEIFPNGILPPLNGFGVSFHYPGQFLKSYDNMRLHWQSQQCDMKRSNGIHLRINILEVAVRRNTKTRPCNEDWRMDDFRVFQQYIEKGVKCVSPYHQWNLSYPACDTMEKMSQAYFPLGDARMKYKQPCKSAEKVVYEYSDLDFSNNTTTVTEDWYIDVGISENDLPLFLNSSYFNYLVVQMKSNTLKVIEHKPAYDIQNFVGNSGGYVGLFLGMVKENA